MLTKSKGIFAGLKETLKGRGSGKIRLELYLTIKRIKANKNKGDIHWSKRNILKRNGQ